MCIISAQGVGLRQCAQDIGGKTKSSVHDNGRGRYSPNNLYNNGFLRLYLDGQRNRSRKEGLTVIDTIVNCGAVPALVRNLQASDTVKNDGDSNIISYQHEVKEGCAFVLGLIATKREHQQLIIDAGALPCLIDLLRKHKISTISKQLTGLLRRVVHTITNIARENTIIKALVRVEGGIPPLIELLEFNDKELQRAAAQALGILACNNIDNKNQIVECHALPTLVLMLRSEDPLIHYEAVALIRNLAVRTSLNIKKEVLLAGTLQPIICLLSSGYLRSQIEAAVLVAEIAETDADSKIHLAQRGAIPPLVDLLKSPDTVLRIVSTFALGVLAEDSHNQVGIAKSGGIEPLLNHLTLNPLTSSKGPLLQKCAAIALYPIVVNEDNIPDLIKTGGFQKLKAGHIQAEMEFTKVCVAIMLKRLEWKIRGRVLKQLLYLLRCAEEGVQRHVAIALAYLCCPYYRKTIFIDNSGLQLLLDILKSPIRKQKGDASAALHKLAAKACSSVSLFDAAPPSPIPQMYLGEEYLNNPKLSDVTFVVEGRRFYAHRYCLLSSDGFRSMFDSTYMESKAKHIMIPNIKWDVFELMMRFIYTGTVDVNFDIAQDLLRVSNQYLIDGLKRFCEYTIAQEISVNNVKQLYKMSEDFNAIALKHACILFMLEKFDDLSSQSWYDSLVCRSVPVMHALFTTLLIRSQPVRRPLNFNLYRRNGENVQSCKRVS